MMTNLLIGLIALNILVVIVILIWLFKIESRLKRFFLGKKGSDLEDTLSSIGHDVSVLGTNHTTLSKKVEHIDVRVRRSIQGVETIRFNPFPDQGSNQSFAISFLNEEGSGVVISSLYSRERMSIFAKPIQNNTSAFELTEEESEAVTKAKLS